MAVTNASSVLNSVKYELDTVAGVKTHSCCGGCCSGTMSEITGGLGVLEDYDDAAESSRADCCEKGYCQSCNSLPFLIANLSLSFQLTNSSALAEINRPFSVWNFEALFFRPPRS